MIQLFTKKAIEQNDVKIYLTHQCLRSRQNKTEEIFTINSKDITGI